VVEGLPSEWEVMGSISDGFIIPKILLKWYQMLPWLALSIEWSDFSQIALTKSGATNCNINIYCIFKYILCYVFKPWLFVQFISSWIGLQRMSIIHSKSRKVLQCISIPHVKCTYDNLVCIICCTDHSLVLWGNTGCSFTNCTFGLYFNTPTF